VTRIVDSVTLLFASRGVGGLSALLVSWHPLKQLVRGVGGCSGLMPEYARLNRLASLFCRELKEARPGLGKISSG
ncbi:hypothetical protein LINPERPRIM_LOCUS12768, partial [Linum perenne]